MYGDVFVSMKRWNVFRSTVFEHTLWRKVCTWINLYKGYSFWITRAAITTLLIQLNWMFCINISDNLNGVTVSLPSPPAPSSQMKNSGRVTVYVFISGSEKGGQMYCRNSTVSSIQCTRALQGCQAVSRLSTHPVGRQRTGQTGPDRDSPPSQSVLSLRWGPRGLFQSDTAAVYSSAKKLSRDP